MPDITGCWVSNQAMPRRPNITIHKRSVKGLRLGYGGGVFWIFWVGVQIHPSPRSLYSPHGDRPKGETPCAGSPPSIGEYLGHSSVKRSEFPQTAIRQNGSPSRNNVEPFGDDQGELPPPRYFKTLTRICREWTLMLWNSTSN